MRRRFSRGRRSGGGDRAVAIDASQVFGRIVEEGIVSTSELTPLQEDLAASIPPDYAAVGTGESAPGKPLVVSYAARGGDALLAGLAAGAGLAAQTEGWAGPVIAVAARWTSADRSRLGLVGDIPFELRAITAPSLESGAAEVAPERAPLQGVLPPAVVAAQLADPAERELFLRAAVALEGLASKHGGSVRGVGRSVEMVVLARRVAELCAEDGASTLVTLLPQRTVVELRNDSLAGALDTLEGQLRKRLNDRRTRDGEEGLRARGIPLLTASGGLRSILLWPSVGADVAVLDLAGIDDEGRVVAGAVRQELGLPALGEILDATVALQPSLPLLLAGAAAPVRFDSPRLALAAREFTQGAARVLPQLSLGHDLFEIRSSRGRGLELAPVSSGEAASRPVRSSREEPSSRGEGARDGQVASEDEGSADRTRTRSRRRGRRSRGRGGESRGEESGPSASAPESGDAPAAERSGGGGRRKRSSRFDEVSLFDLEEEGDSAGNARKEGGSGGRRRDRGRSRRRGRASESSSDPAAVEPGPKPEARRATSGDASDPEASAAEVEPPVEVDDDSAIEETLADLPDDVSDLDSAPEPAYEEDDDSTGEDDAEKSRRAAELERRRREKLVQAEAVVEQKPKPPRRRAAIVAHADRDAIFAALLLARDIRLIDGIWIFPQAELMTFFRSVATDLREETPIYLVGFTPSPARDVIQAAGLYRERLLWFDHHVWPPEDLEALRESLGEDAVQVQPGTGSSLPVVLETCSRRSRFSDKLVDLATGRFTQHDYERWGRLWWSRIGELAERTGECRASLDGLLNGRPSDLAREAASVAVPPPPPEVAFVSAHDFRLVHFAGYSLVALEVPAEFDLHLCGRIARERYAAPLSLAWTAGETGVVLAGDETTGRRALDYPAMVEHLAAKFAWLKARPDDDHVARFDVADLSERPERIDDVIGEIAMGRSILER